MQVLCVRSLLDVRSFQVHERRQESEEDYPPNLGANEKYEGSVAQKILQMRGADVQCVGIINMGEVRVLTEI